MLIVYLAVDINNYLIHVFTRQGIVISYLLTNVAILMFEDARDLRLLLSSNLFNQSSVDIQFSLSLFQRGKCFVYAIRNLLSSVQYVACGINQIEAQLLVDTFVKGLC